MILTKLYLGISGGVFIVIGALTLIFVAVRLWTRKILMKNAIYLKENKYKLKAQ